MASYHLSLQAGEEVAARAIDAILTEGGYQLWQRYLAQKAFPFAADKCTDSIVTYMKMCFVPHDYGAEDPDDWAIEPEPVAAEIDSWARMHLQVHRRPKLDMEDIPENASLSGKSKSIAGTSKSMGSMQPSRSKKKGAQGPANANEKPSRITPIQEHFVLDDEEEKLREAKAEVEAQRRQAEARKREEAKLEEEELRKLAALHEEMAKRPFTFDLEGNIMWIEEQNYDKLPKVQEQFAYHLGREKHAKLEQAGAETAAVGKTKRSKKDKGSKKPESDFNDTFTKLQNEQPPIIDTMNVRSGVSLVSLGKTKTGPPHMRDAGQMSRKEYRVLAEREMDVQGDSLEVTNNQSQESASNPAAAARGSQVLSRDGPSGSLPSLGALGDQKASQQGGTPQASGRGLPRGAGSKEPPSSGMNKSTAQSDSEVEKRIHKQPRAPAFGVRNKKHDAIGHLGGLPRYHKTGLGCPYGYSAAQPPLGATMGHGLMRTASARNAFYFPSSTPDTSVTGLLRSTSEASFRDWASMTAPTSGFGRPNSRCDSPGALEGGRILPETKSAAYRRIKELLPADLPPSSNSL